MSSPYSTALPMPRLRWWERSGLAVLGLVLLALLLTARWLTPSPSGLGTHQGLGLPECTARMVFDVRCPACGMTTSWAHLTRGSLVRALQTNVGGVLLGLVAIATVPWSLWSAWKGAVPSWSPSDRTFAFGALAVALITIADWAWRLNH
jgi:hypothetical protein